MFSTGIICFIVLLLCCFSDADILIKRDGTLIETIVYNSSYSTRCPRGWIALLVEGDVKCIDKTQVNDLINAEGIISFQTFLYK